MRTFKALSSAFLLAALAASAARAQTSAGAESFDFLMLDANARAVGMAGAYTALANDSNALLYNPAGLGRIKAHEVTFMHNQYVEGLTQQYVGFSARQGFGLNLNYLNFGDITRTRLDAKDGGIGSFGVSDLAIGAGYGHTFGEVLSLGLGGKYLRETIDNISASGYAADAGLLASIPEMPGLTFGAAILNMGPEVRFLKTKEKLPLLGRAGAAYSFTGGGAAHTVAFDLTKERTDKMRVGIGGETVLGKMMALRLGFNTRNNTDIGLTGGAGWTVKAMSIDYAFVPFGDLGISHRLSLTFRWGADQEAGFRRAERKPIKEDPANAAVHFARIDPLMKAHQYQRAKDELAAGVALLPAEDRRHVFYHERLGRIAMKEGDCPRAKAHFMEGLKFAAATGLSDPSVADAYAGMGQCLAQQNNEAYAVKFFKKAIEAGPSAETRLLIEAQLQSLSVKKP